MFKKFILISVALAVVASMILVPTTLNAADFTDSCVVDINYSEKSLDDSKGDRKSTRLNSSHL